MSEDEELIDRIYEAAVVPERWPQLLEDIGQSIDAALGSIYLTRADFSMRLIGTKAAEKLVEEFSSLNPPIEPIRFRKAAEIQFDGFYTDLDFNDETIFSHPVYTEFLHPRNYGWFTAVDFAIPTGEQGHVGFERFRDRGPFEPDCIAFLNRLRPHMGRAAVLASQVGLERARGMVEALSTVGIPGAVLKAGGKLFLANARFEQLMPHVVVDRAERIGLIDGPADALLSDALARLSTNAGKGQSRSIPVVPATLFPPLIFHVVPIRGAAGDIFSGGTALLMVTPVDRAAVPTAEVLQGLFDLTPAEARVARGIAQAKTVETIALESGVSRETVRSQLAAVLAKTGMSRQAELVALLGGKAVIEE